MSLALDMKLKDLDILRLYHDKKVMNYYYYYYYYYY